ncbi:hypothetical protein [Pedosphaera parvula]|uniref:Uncharacterized protein n=1 Tax=Pedosphaera parvula (strain Ellin514) TaxID=320771 RepID=B9XEE5_PEDPL|nr:hypothetical protein [Pedosphaera parvula]EEF61659.1 hypothetical protein Cflav_PD4699 [Pedosphaera parvula Ellin514]
MDELDMAIEWGLSRNPKHFYNISKDFYVWKTERLVAGIPQLIIVYRFVEIINQIILISVSEIPDSASEEE